MCGSKSTTSTSTQTPNPQGAALLGQITGRAQNIDTAPLTAQQYVAPLNANQNSALNNESLYNVGQPYINQAQGYFSQSGAPVTQTDVSNNLNTFLPALQNANMAMQHQQDAQQLAAVGGQDAMAGAGMGSRDAVAKALLGQQQALVNNQTNAGVNSAAYNAAVQEALAGKLLESGAGYGIGNLGQETYGQQSGAIGTQLQQGNQQQAQTNAELNLPLANQLLQAQYNQAQLGQLASIDLGAASGYGGTTTQSQPYNLFGQVLGAGATGLGIYAGMGGFKKDGGAVTGYADGGVTPYAQMHFPGAPTTTAPNGNSGLSDMGMAAAKMAKSWKDSNRSPVTIDNPPQSDFAVGGLVVSPYAMKGTDDGGFAPMDTAQASDWNNPTVYAAPKGTDAEFLDNATPGTDVRSVPPNSFAYPDPRSTASASGPSYGGAGPMGAASASPASFDTANGSTLGSGFGAPEQAPPLTQMQVADTPVSPSSAAPYAHSQYAAPDESSATQSSDDSTITVNADNSASPAVSNTTGINWKKLALPLIQGGAAAMQIHPGSKNPFYSAFQSASAGFGAGAQAYAAQEQRDLKARQEAANAAYRQMQIKQKADQLSQSAKQHADNLAVKTQALAQGHYQFLPGTQLDAEGKPVPGIIRANTRTGQTAFDTDTQMTGRGGQSQNVYSIKKAAYLAVHPGDEEGALAYAGSRKQMSDQEINRAALLAAQRDITNATSPQDLQRQQARAAQYATWLRSSQQGQAAPPAPATGTPQPQQQPAPQAATPQATPPPPGVTKDEIIQRAQNFVKAHPENREGVKQWLELQGLSLGNQ